MTLRELLDTPNSELSTEDLRRKIDLLQRMKIRKPKKGRPRVKSNKEASLDNLIKNLSEEELTKLLAELEEV